MEKDSSSVCTRKPVCRHERDGLFVRFQDVYLLLPYADILHVEASGSYCHIHTRDRSKITVAHRLNLLERRLPSTHFVRVHHSFILNLFEITKFVGNTVYIGNRDYPVGRKYREQFLSLLNIL